MHRRKAIPLFIFLVLALTAFPIHVTVTYAQTGQKADQADTLTSKEIEHEGDMMNKQIMSINRDILKVVKDYKLTSDDLKKNIRIVPFQTTLNYGDNGKGNYLEVTRHKFIRNPLNLHRIIGIKNKTFRIYYSGENVSKIEMQIFERYYDDNSAVQVDIVDPSPGDEQTNDVAFTHTLLVNYTIQNDKFRKDVKLVDNKKLGDIQNSTAFPIRNDLRRDFLLPNLTFVNNVLLDVAETYYKGKKDAESLMLEFLRKSVDY